MSETEIVGPVLQLDASGGLLLPPPHRTIVRLGERKFGPTGGQGGREGSCFSPFGLKPAARHF